MLCSWPSVEYTFSAMHMLRVAAEVGGCNDIRYRRRRVFRLQLTEPAVPDDARGRGKYLAAGRVQRKRPLA
jgi:hypothetical protein